METNQKLIEERVAMLPPYIRAALDNINWGPEILNIGKKHGLHVDDMGTLQTETVLVLVGLVHPNDYPANLKQELHVPQEKIDGIVKDVNEKILKTIRQSLIDFIEHEDAQEKGTEQETAQGWAKESNQGSNQMGSQQNIFQKTGIELEPETVPLEGANQMPIGTTVSPIERDTLEHSGVQMSDDTSMAGMFEAGGSAESENIDRNTILNDIENPPKSQTNQFSHLIRTKLSDAVITPSEKTKYEDSKPVPPQAPARKSNDPYREVV